MDLLIIVGMPGKGKELSRLVHRPAAPDPSLLPERISLMLMRTKTSKKASG